MSELSYYWPYCVLLNCRSALQKKKRLTGVSKAVQADAKQSNNRSSYQTSHEVIRKTGSFGREQETLEGSRWGQWCVCVETMLNTSSFPLFLEGGKSFVPSCFSSLEESDIDTLSATRSNPLYYSLPQSSYSALLSTVPYPLYLPVPWPLCYAAVKLGGFSCWNIISKSPQIYSR